MADSAAKALHGAALASGHRPGIVQVARESAVSTSWKSCAGDPGAADGFSSLQIQGAGRSNLVLENILANPLRGKKMAKPNGAASRTIGIDHSIGLLRIRDQGRRDRRLRAPGCFCEAISGRKAGAAAC